MDFGEVIFDEPFRKVQISFYTVLPSDINAIDVQVALTKEGIIIVYRDVIEVDDELSMGEKKTEIVYTGHQSNCFIKYIN